MLAWVVEPFGAHHEAAIGLRFGIDRVPTGRADCDGRRRNGFVGRKAVEINGQLPVGQHGDKFKIIRCRLHPRQAGPEDDRFRVVMAGMGCDRGG